MAKKKKKTTKSISPSVRIDIKIDDFGYEVGTAYNIEYSRGDKIYKHRMKKARVVVGKGFIVLVDPSIKITPRGIIGG